MVEDRYLDENGAFRIFKRPKTAKASPIFAAAAEEVVPVLTAKEGEEVLKMEDLKDLSSIELKAIATTRNVWFNSKSSKSEIISRLLNNPDNEGK